RRASSLLFSCVHMITAEYLPLRASIIRPLITCTSSSLSSIPTTQQ
ncbi:1165_t:CDS:2, partial [Dentiscutata heterogama]